uniref:Protein singed wings 2 n=1 Tax=Lygus hesperus TaxID=30085 RepID=A0A0A9XE94_LYGHE
MKTLLVLCVLIASERYAVGGFCKSHRNSLPYCERDREKTDKVLCTGTFNHSYTAVTKLKTLVICNILHHEYDPRLISKFQHLYRFTLIYSNITHFTHPFPEHLHLQILNLTRLDLTHINVEIFRNLRNLKILDLSYNKLKTFGKHHSEFLPKLEQLYLRGNSLECNHDLKWILGKRNGKISLSKKVVDLNQVTCSVNEQYPGKPALIVMNWMKCLDSECPHHGSMVCKCNLDNVVSPPGLQSLVPVITVNCSNMGFTVLPSKLPHNTTVLILNNNQITDVSPLLNNSWYQGVSDIYLDNNRISAVDQLERADWLSSFRVFSLRGNNLTTIPTYAFDHAFERNTKIAKVYFGNNSWVCDCSFTPGFQELLRKYSPLIYDIKDIRCAVSEYDSNSKEVIKGLALVSICRDPAEFPLSPWDVLNIILITLIFTVYFKLIYDYWVYKTTTKLPWVATKIP